MGVLDGLTFYDPTGRRVGDGDSVTIVEYLRGGPDDARCTAFVELGSRRLVMKSHRWRRLRRRITATLGRSSLNNEMVMLHRARTAGFATAQLFAHAVQRRLALISRKVLLTIRVDDHVSLDEWLRAATVRDEPSSFTEARQALATLLGRVRSAGLADRDFGAHNLLVQKDADLPSEVIWVDLEAAYPASPQDADATCRTVGAALANWWICTGENQDRLVGAFASIRQHVPEPRGGWGNGTRRVNAVIFRRVDRQVRSGRAGRIPDAL